METKGNFQAGWNLGQHLIDDIGELLHSARISFVNGNIQKYYWDFYMVRKTVEPFMSEKELVEGIKQEIEIENIIGVCNSKPVTTEDKIKVIEVRKKLNILLKKYDGSVMSYLRKYGFLVPPKKDRTILIG